MERIRYLRKPTVSAVNGLPRRRQRITTLRDSTDQDIEMDLQETTRSGDRVKLQKVQEREFPKRRRVDRSSVQQRNDAAESYEETDSSDEEYYEEEEELRIHQHNRTIQISPESSSLSNNHRGTRTLRSSPVLRSAVDEIFGVPVPRRARSASAKRLHHCNSGSGGFGEELGHRIFSPFPATVGLIGSVGASSSSSGLPMKKKMKSVDRSPPGLSGASNPNSSVIRDDIEIEVAEALFDLMRQSQSRSQSSERQERVGRDSINTANDELKISKAGGGKDENNAFSVQNEPSIKVNAETILADSAEEREGRTDRKKFPEDLAQELMNGVYGDGLVNNKVKVGSPKESESPSCVKVNAYDIQDPTVTKAHNEAIIAETKKEARLKIDLMVIPPFPPSPERDALVDIGTDPEEVMAQVVQKKSETISEDGPLAVARGTREEMVGAINSIQLHDDISSGGNSTTKHQRNQSTSNSILPFPIGLSTFSGVVPHLGYMPPPQAVMPVNGNVKSSTIIKTPRFKFSQLRSKRCVTHQFLAQNIHHHKELMKTSLSSASTGPAAFFGTKSSNITSQSSPAPNFIPGNTLLGDFHGGQNSPVETVKDKNSDVVVASNVNNTANGKSVLQHASHPASTSNILRGPGFTFSLGHHQTTMMAPANSSGSPQSTSTVGNASLHSNPAGRVSVNLPLPNASGAVNLNHALFPSNEAYMAILQSNGYPISTSTNKNMPPFKGGPPSVPFFNASLYSSPLFNVNQNQQHLTIPHTAKSSSYKQIQCLKQTSDKVSDNKFPTSATTNSQQSANGLVAHSLEHSNSQTFSLSAQSLNLTMIPPVSVGGGAVVNKNIEPSQQGSKGRAELSPQPYALSFCSNASPSPGLNFSSVTQNSAVFHMLPDMSWNGNTLVDPKSFPSSEGKSSIAGSQAFNFPKTECKEMSALASIIPPIFDGLARSINFLPSSLTGNQQHQQQLVQAQNPQMHHLQLSGTTQVKISAPNGIPGSFLAGIYPNNGPVFAQVSGTNDNLSMPQLKSSQGQAHMTFGNSPISATSLMSGSSPNPSVSRNMGMSQATMSALASQEAEATPCGPSQKSSPACRRNVPSILSTCPSQLPELKY